MNGFIKKPIILIGGTAGSGKTTLANKLACLLGIDHRLGTGFVREIVRNFTTEEKDPELFTSTFASQDPVKNTIVQADKLYKPILSCIERARKEGTSLIIEGNHLLPHLYHNLGADYFFVLSAPDEDQHSIRFTGKTHSKRIVTEQDFENARKIDNFIIKNASIYNIKYFVSSDESFNELIKEIR